MSTVAKADTKYMEITAQIDGSDTFQLSGDTWNWIHYNNHVPETHEYTQATIINSDFASPTTQSFLSTWSHGTGYGASSDSNTVTGLSSLYKLFGSGVEIYMVKTAGRSYTELSEIPSALNNYGFSIYINDDSYGSHDTYSFEIWAKGSPLPSTPEPVSSILFLLGSGLVALRRTKKS